MQILMSEMRRISNRTYAHLPLLPFLYFICQRWKIQTSPHYYQPIFRKSCIFGRALCAKIVQIQIYLWSVFYGFRTEYLFKYSPKIRTRKISVFGHFYTMLNIVETSYTWTILKVKRWEWSSKLLQCKFALWFLCVFCFCDFTNLCLDSFQIKC